jgi:Cysteine rich repeat
MSRHAVYSVIAFALFSTPVVAAADHQGSASEQDACRRDVVKLCKDVAPEDGPILNCLKTYRVKLTTACRTVLESHGQ